ncbi:MAG TPA: hypothetical protein VLA74_06845 [Nitrososphaeraceae archaeon]|jgi:hypothetical protein|nr:hypothetical protein [Nitrososphaeraceae archaeon]
MDSGREEKENNESREEEEIRTKDIINRYFKPIEHPKNQLVII